MIILISSYLSLVRRCCCIELVILALLVVEVESARLGQKLFTENVVISSESNNTHHSSNPVSFGPSRTPFTRNPQDAITFSEFPIGIDITNQYVADKNVQFTSSVKIVSTDNNNGTGLAGFPRLPGTISGSFVNATNGRMILVQSFRFDIVPLGKAGLLSVEWFDPRGMRIGKATNTGPQDDRIGVRGGNIASFTIRLAVNNNNNNNINNLNISSGFTIDNFTSTPASTSILFRELDRNDKDRSWGPPELRIPGFDHVALNYFGSVYESHPGYKFRQYVADNNDILETRNISFISGVQNQHTYGTFKNNAPRFTKSPVIDFQEIPIDPNDAITIRDIIQTKLDSGGFLSFGTTNDFTAILDPPGQKGRNNSYTGCGLIEWAAEQAGINRGQGFFPNALESIVTQKRTYPLLSPQLLFDAMRDPDLVFNATQIMKGFFDPVDYLVTDPLGRRTGVVNVTRFNEIPTTNFNKEGKAADIEHLIIYNPIPGEYNMKVYGIPGKKGVAVLEIAGRPSVEVRNDGNGTTPFFEEMTVEIPVVAGSRGDVNGDGQINATDLVLLQEKIVVVVGGFANTGDMNGDGTLDQADVDLLSLYLDQLETSSPSNRCSSKSNQCGGLLFPRHMMHQKRNNRCIQRCMMRLVTRLRQLLGGNWACGSCEG